MVNTATLLLFIPTFFLVSITPGMCMTLAMTLGMTVGVRRTFWMMGGEVLGVALVAAAAVVGVAALMLEYPLVFQFLKYGGGLYLGWLGVQMWRSRGSLAINAEELDRPADVSRWGLATQGFVTAIANPKGWAFMVALLPPFIDQSLAIAPQMSVLIGVIVLSELVCMTLYASGGKGLRHFLSKGGNVQVLNRIAGSLMIGVGVWLALG